MKKDLLIKLLEKIKKENSFVMLKKWFPSFNEKLAIENVMKLNGIQISKLLKIQSQKTFLLYLYQYVDGLELNREKFGFLCFLNTNNVKDWIVLMNFMGLENTSVMIKNIKKFIKSSVFVESIENLIFNGEVFALQDLSILSECSYNICEVCDLIAYSKNEETLLNYYPSLIKLVGSTCNINVLKVYNLIKNGNLFKCNIHPLALADIILKLEPEKAVILEEIMNYDSCRKSLQEHFEILLELDLNDLYEDEYEFERTALADRFRLYVKSHRITKLAEQKRVLKNAIKDKNVDILKDFFVTTEEKCENVESNVIDIRTRRKI